MPTANRLKREIRFFQQGGLCFYCKKRCRQPPVGRPIKKPLHDHATLEHLRDRFDKRRRGRDSLAFCVMACFECNQRRSNERQAEFRPDFMKRSRVDRNPCDSKE